MVTNQVARLSVVSGFALSATAACIPDATLLTAGPVGGNGGDTASGATGHGGAAGGGGLTQAGGGGATSSGGGAQGGGLPNGSPCANDDQCLSGNCPSQDAVCCDLACDMGCYACLASKTCQPDGSCAPIAAGQNPDGDCDGEQRCFDGDCLNGTIAFVTSTTQSGALGGLDGADQLCTELAEAACLPGSYMAWLSTETASPATRFNHQSVPYRMVDGTQIADGWSDLADGSLDALFNLTELGTTPLTGTTGCGDPFVTYTATEANGTLWLHDPPLHCDNWTTTAGAGSWGRNTSTLGNWTKYCSSPSAGSCSALASLYCFEQ